jgi:hypothetical protein
MYMLNQGGSLQNVQHEISTLALSGGTATAGVAIRQAYREGFLTQNGGRTDAAHIIVHVSSGPPSDPTFYQQEVSVWKHSQQTCSAATNLPC